MVIGLGLGAVGECRAELVSEPLTRLDLLGL
jgi:hypothetical protein